VVGYILRWLTYLQTVTNLSENYVIASHAKVKSTAQSKRGSLRYNKIE